MNLMDLMIKIGVNDQASGAISTIATGVRSFARVGVAAVGAVGAGMIAFSKSAVDTGKEFDKSMSQVAATLGVTTDEIDDLRTYAMEMGATTAFSAVQAADALNYMALAGYDSNKSMEMLPTVLDLAAAGNMELARASDMVTDAESALGLTTEETAQMVDQMARTASKSNTSVEQLGDAILTIGGTASFMAGGTDRLNTVLGILADNGIKGSEAGTHLRNMLLKLSSPTEKGIRLMKKMGLEIYDGSGKMRDMQDIMLDLNDAMSDMTEEGRVQTLSELFNSRDLSAVNALLHTSAKRWDELGEEIKDAQGAAKKMADTQLDNLAGDITLFKSAMEGAEITLSNALTPAIREFVQTGTAEIGKLDEAFQMGGISGLASQIGETLGDIVVSISENIPTFIETAGTIASSFVGALVNGIIDGAPLMMTSAAELISKLADGITEEAPAIGAKIGDLLGTLISNAPQLIIAGARFVYNLAIGILQAIPGIVSGIAKGIAGAFSDPVSSDVQLALASVDELKAAVDDVKKGVDITAELEKVDSKFSLVYKWINTYDTLSKKVKRTSSEEIELQTAIEGLNSLLPETAQIVQNETGEWVNNTTEIRNNIEAMKDREKANAYINGSKKVLQELVDMEIRAKAEADLSKQYSINAEGMKLSAKTINDALDTMVDYYDDIVYRGETIMAQDLPAPARALAEQWGITGPITADQMSMINTTLQEMASETASAAEEALALSAAHGEASEVANKAVADLQKTYDSYVSAAAALNDAAAAAEAAGAAVGDGFVRGMNSRIAAVGAAAVSLARSASQGVTRYLSIRSPSKLMQEYGAFAGEGFAIGLGNRDTIKDVEETAAMLASAAVPSVESDEFETPNVKSFLPMASESNRVFRLYLDGDKLVGGTSERMDSSLGTMQEYQLRWEGA